MGYIDNTWIAYANEREVETEVIQSALARVARHYQELYAEPLAADRCIHRALGMALWRRAEGRLRWPLWVERDGMTVASTNAPTGWERTISSTEISEAPLALGRALVSDPGRLALLNSPFVLSAYDQWAQSLVIVNDALAAARLYEMRTRDGWVWSNRLGALPLFAGIEPRADAESWAIHAATGWFLGSKTPIQGASKVPAGSAIVITAYDGRARVSHQRTDAVHDLVTPRRRRDHRLRDQAAEAAQQAISLSSSIDSIWSVPPTVNLSGGRDSRISAAGAIMAGIDAEFRTMDISPGEVEVVTELISAAPRAVSHQVTSPERGEPSDALKDRINRLHLIHDGMANPMAALQSSPRLPERQPSSPLVTGHGGELGHGFYYSKRRTLRELRGAKMAGLVKRLERSGRQRHSAAREEAYAAHVREIERTFKEGQSHGLKGPNLLDYYYLAERLPFRAGLGARNDRYSACVTPAFIRGCFDLSPRQRLRAKFHRAVMSHLIPAWNKIPFFAAEGGRVRPMNRYRIWEKPRHAEEMEEVLASTDLWADLFYPVRVHALWREARAGSGHSHFESVFMRIAWRVSFEQHLKVLARGAQGGQGSLRGRSDR